MPTIDSPLLLNSGLNPLAVVRSKPGDRFRVVLAEEGRNRTYSIAA